MRIAFVVVVALCAVACSRSRVCKGGELAEAKTAVAEHNAFEHIAARCGSLSMAAYDARGALVPFSDPKWPTKVRRIRIVAGGAAFEHVVIDGRNVGVLMGE